MLPIACRRQVNVTYTTDTCMGQLQEADLQRYRTRLVSMGKIENAAGANLKPRRHKTFEESIKAFEVVCFALVHTQCMPAQLLLFEHAAVLLIVGMGSVAVCEVVKFVSWPCRCCRKCCSSKRA